MSSYLNKLTKTPKFKYHKADSEINPCTTIDKFLPNLPSNLKSSPYL